MWHLQPMGSGQIIRLGHRVLSGVDLRPNALIGSPQRSVQFSRSFNREELRHG